MDLQGLRVERETPQWNQGNTTPFYTHLAPLLLSSAALTVTALSSISVSLSRSHLLNVHISSWADYCGD